jgi:dUTP pyrophosphatase
VSKNLQVKFKKLSDKAILPSYAKEGDAGLDLTCTRVEEIDNQDFGYIQYHTDLSVEIPKGYVGYIFPRSSVSNTGLILANSVGVIDSGYRGEIMVRFKHIKSTKKYNIGDRVCQLIIMPIPKVEIVEVEELSNSSRQSAGFGSTGK